MAALLRTVMNASVFADIEIPAARVAMPLVWQSLGEIVLEAAVAHEIGKLLFGTVHNVVVNLFLLRVQRTKLSGMVVDDSNCAAKTQFTSATTDGKSIFRIPDRTAQHGVNVDIKLGVCRKPLELLIQHSQALF